MYFEVMTGCKTDCGDQREDRVVLITEDSVEAIRIANSLRTDKHESWILIKD